MLNYHDAPNLSGWRALARLICTLLVAATLFFGQAGRAQAAGSWSPEWSSASTYMGGINYAGGIWVAGNWPGRIFINSGGGWSPKSFGTDQLYGAAYGSGNWVVVGYGGEIFTSTDSSTWTPQTSDTGDTLYSVAYGDGYFVAVGDYGTVVRSPDGITWAAQTVAGSAGLYFVKWTGSQFVAVGADESIYTSSDGAAWSLRHSGPAMYLQGIAVNGSTVIAVGGDGSSGSICKSTDGGSAWACTTYATGIYGVAYGAGKFVGVGDPVDGNYTIISSADDGASWAPESAGAGNKPLLHVDYGAGKFVAVGSDGADNSIILSQIAQATAPSITPASTSEDTQSASGLVLTNADGATHFKITGITGGTLYKNDGTTVISNGSYITAAEGADGLKFTPGANLYSPGSSFGFTAQSAMDASGTGLSTGTSASITVDAAADPPSVTAATTSEDTQSASGLVITPNAVDGSEVGYFKITGITGGTLYKHDGTTAISEGSFITAAEGSAGLKFAPGANLHSPGSFGFTVQGATSNTGAGLSTGTAASVTVSAVADTPSVTAASTSEDTRTSSGLVISRNAADSTEVAYFKISGITGGTLYQSNGTTVISEGGFITAAQGAAGLKFTPAADKNSAAGDPFGLTVQGALDTSGTGISPGAAASVTVTAVNDAPAGVADSLSGVAEDSGTRVIPFADLLANDSTGPANESGQTLTITGVSNPVGGAVSILGTDVLFTPAADFNGSASFSYTLQDNGTTGGSADPKTATATAGFTVTPVADTPSVTGAATPEDTQTSSGLVISRNAADGAEIGYFKITGITGGTLYQNNGTTAINSGEFITAAQGAAGLKFTPAADKNSPAGDTFGFTVQGAADSSGTGLSPLGADAVITVSSVADAPSVTAAATSEDTQTASGLVVTRSAVDGSEVTYFKITGITNGTLYQNDGTTVISSGDFITVAQGGAGLRFIPAADKNSPAGDSFGFTMQAALDNSGTGISAGTAAGITVAAVADTPSVTGAATAEDTQSATGLVITRNAVDGAEVTHFKITGITNGTLYQHDGTTVISEGSFITAAQGGAGLKFTPAADKNSTTGDAFGFTVQAAADAAGSGLSPGTDAAVTVSPVADAPSVTAATTAEDTQSAAGLVITRSPADGTEVGYFKITGITGGTLYQNDGATAISNGDFISAAQGGAGLKFTPAADQNSPASDTFSFTVQGALDNTGSGISAGTAAGIIVTAVADAPAVTAAATSEDTQSASGLVITRNAVDGAEVTHFKITGITNGTLYQNDSTTVIKSGDFITAAQGGAGLKFTPAADKNSSAGDAFSFTVQAATDASGSGLSAGTGAAITVSPVADAPSVTASTTAEDTQSASGLVITRNAMDGTEVGSFKITGITGGTLYQSDGATAINDGDFITAAQGLAGLRFTPAADKNSPAGDSFGLTVQGALDGTGSGLSPAGTAAGITVTEVNDPPSGAADRLADMAEDAGTRAIPFSDLLGNDSKGPASEGGQTLTVAGVTDAVGGTVSISGTDVLFTPTVDYSGPASFTYTLQDDGTTDGGADPQTATASAGFTVAPAADAPAVTAAATAEDTQSSSGLVITRNAVDGAEVTHFKITSITGGSLYQNDGLTAIHDGDFITAAQGGAGLKFTPDANLYSPGSSFGFTAQGALDATGAGLSPTGTAASITVSPAADAPAVTAATTSEDTQSGSGLVITPNAVDGAEIGYYKITGITGGTLYQNDGTTSIKSGDFITAAEGGAGLKFTPATDLYSPGSSFGFTVQAALDETGNGISSGTAASVTVSPAADTPSVTGATTSEETQSAAGLVITPNAVDGAEVIYFKISGVAGGTLYLNDGATTVSNGDFITAAQGGAGLKFTPGTDLNSTAGDSFGFTVQAGVDNTGTGLSGGVAATVAVTEVNDAPGAAADTLADVAEDSGTRSIPFADLLSNDTAGPANESGQSLTITGVSDAVGGAVSISGTNVVFTPTADTFGPASFRYTVQDSGTTGGGADPKSAAAKVSFGVTPVADAPSVSAAVTSEDTQSASGLVIARNAVDGAEVGYYKITGIASGTLYQNDGTTAISDGDFITVAQGSAGLKFTPAADKSSPAGDTFGFTVQAATDAAGSGLSTGTAAAITVSAVADAPGVTAATTSEDTQSAAGLVVTRNAVDGAEVTHFKITGITGGTLYQNDGTTAINDGDFITAAQGSAGLKFTPGADQYSPGNRFGFTVQAALDQSGMGLSPASTAAGITVNPVADAPSMTAATTSEDTQSASGLEIARNAVDGAEVGYFKITGITNGTLFLSDGTTAVHDGDFISAAEGNVGLKFTPAADRNSSAGDSFGFTVQAALDASGTGLSPTGTAASITVNPVADAPAVTPATTAEDTQSAAGLVIARNTVDGAEVTHFKITGITGGSLYQNDGTTAIHDGDFITAAQGGAGLRFTPAAETNSLAGDRFGFTVQAALDATGSGISPAGTAAAVTVTEVNDAPTGAADSLSSMAEDAAARSIPFADLLANDTLGPANESGQTLTIVGVSGAVGGTASISGTNVLFTPAADFYGPASFSYTLQDDGTTAGTADPKTATATVSFDVTPVADAPAVTAATTSEETQSASGLVITRSAADGAEVTHFKISAITGGTLYQNDGTTRIQDGDFVTAAQGAAGLKFTPSADLYSPVSAFGFTVQGALDATGAGLSPTGTAASITVNPVADAPAVTAATTSEDTQSAAGLVISRNTVDGAEVAHFKITSITGGALYQNDGTTAIHDGDFITAAQGGAGLRFTPAANLYSPVSTFGFTVQGALDNAGAGLSPTGPAASITVNPVADTPAVTAATTSEQTQSAAGLVITRNAVDGAEVTHFKISGITGGSLYQNDGTTAISDGEFITAAQGAAGLKFTPAEDQNTPAGDSFGFTVQAALDASGAGLSSAGAAATVTVTEVNDAPTGTADSLSDLAEDSATRTIPFADLLANDSKGPANENGQTLTIAGVSDAVGGTVSLSGTDVLFTTATDFYGPASFSYTLQDNGTTAGTADPKTATATVAFDVTPVADAPAVTAATTSEDTQTASGLVLTRSAADGAEVTYFKITAITGGTLYQHDGITAISEGDFITAAEGAAGLKFTPSPDSTARSAPSASRSRGRSTPPARASAQRAQLRASPSTRSPTHRL